MSPLAPLLAPQRVISPYPSGHSLPPAPVPNPPKVKQVFFPGDPQKCDQTLQKTGGCPSRQKKVAKTKHIFKNLKRPKNPLCPFLPKELRSSPHFHRTSFCPVWSKMSQNFVLSGVLGKKHRTSFCQKPKMTELRSLPLMKKKLELRSSTGTSSTWGTLRAPST